LADSISSGREGIRGKMKFKDTVKMSLHELRHSKLRTYLTIIGIIIGIAAVVSIVSVGQGLQARISSNLQGLGADVITVQTGFSRAGGMGFRGGMDPLMVAQSRQSGNLTVKDLTAIKSVQGVKYIGGTISGRKELSFSGESNSVSINGIDPSVWRLITGREIEDGRHLGLGETSAVVIGSRVAGGMFKKPISVNSQITIDGKRFKVVGILTESGSFGGEDSSIFISMKEAADTIGMDSDQFSSIQIKMTDVSLVEEAVNNMEKRLMLSRHVKEDTKDFTVISPLSIQQSVSKITSSVTLFLGGIAGISLLVGAIGISNTMYMSVTERKRQIGLLKALGSTNGEVLRLFLVESGTLGFVGGIIGIIIGSGVSALISGAVGIGFQAPGSQGIETVISPDLLIFAVLFSTAIGVLSGIFPARQASKLQPVDTLRSE